MKLQTFKAARSLRTFSKSSRGANMVEYMILVGLVAIAALVGFQTFGNGVRTKITEQSNTVNGITGTASSGAPTQ